MNILYVVRYVYIYTYSSQYRDAGQAKEILKKLEEPWMMCAKKNLSTWHRFAIPALGTSVTSGLKFSELGA